MRRANILYKNDQDSMMPFTHILRDIDYCSSDIGKTNVLYTYRMSGNLIWCFNFLYYSNFLKYTSSRWYHNIFSDNSTCIYTSDIHFKRDVELVNSLLIQRFLCADNNTLYIHILILQMALFTSNKIYIAVYVHVFWFEHFLLYIYK